MRPRPYFFFALAYLLSLLAACAPGCKDDDAGGGKAGADKPELKEVEYISSNYAAAFEHRVTISPDGAVRVVDKQGTADPPKTEVAEGRLEAGQVEELADLFKEWDELKSEYEQAPDGPVMKIRYGDKTVTAGGRPDTPEKFEKVRLRIEGFVRDLPRKPAQQQQQEGQ